MTSSDPIKNPARDILNLLQRHWKLLVIPMAICTLIAGWYAMKPKSWQASQSLVVRDDMIGDSFKPGRFESLDSMKTAQETILHIAREPSVVRKALEAIGPPKGKKANWLDGEAGIETVEATQSEISIVAPNGAEFGKTEVIVLQVKAKSRERAGDLVTSLLNEIEANLRSVRTLRLSSMESELSESLKLAEEDYKQFASELQKLEREIGPDLPILLNMINDGSSSNDFQIALENIRGIKRNAQAKLDITAKQLESLRATVDRPEELVATSNELLEAQPALRRLKDGLIDAQLKLSDDLGRFEEAHPAISKARFAISETKNQIRQELQIAIRGLQAQYEVRDQQIRRLREEEGDYQDRLQKLTNNRVRYATLASQADKRNEEHAKARAEYAEIKSLGQAAQSVDLMTRIEEPFVGGKPLGPGRTSILGSGVVGGFLIGLGLIMFFSAPGTLPIIPPPTSGPGENMVRPNNQPVPPTPTPRRNPSAPADTQRPNAMRPVQVVKQLERAKPQSTQPTANQPSTPEATVSPNSTTQVVVAKQKMAKIERKPQAETQSQPATAKATPTPAKAPSLKPASKPTHPAPPKSEQRATPVGVLKPGKSEPTAPQLPPVTTEPAAKPISNKMEMAQLAGDNPVQGANQQKGVSQEKVANKEIEQRLAQGIAGIKSEAMPVTRTKTKTTPPLAGGNKTVENRNAEPTLGTTPTPTIQLPQEEHTPARTIDLNTLRKELGSAPLASSESRSEMIQDLNNLKSQILKSADKEGASNEDSKNEDSLHERIKSLTDPSKVVKTPLRPDEDA